MKKELKIIIACGCGMVTSSIILDRVQKVLTTAGIQAQLSTCTVNELELKQQGMDLALIAAQYRKELTIPHMNAVAFITKVNIDLVEEELLQKCNAIMSQ